MTRSTLEILKEIRALGPFPEVVTRVVELGGQASVIPSDLIEVIQTDPGLTVKVLTLCNSAFYGFQRTIASLDEAGNLLGVRSIVNLVLTSTAKEVFGAATSVTQEERRAQWKKCVANALASRILARTHGMVDEERAYTAGLLQNIGYLVLERHHLDALPALEAEMLGGASLLAAEREVLGLHHAEIGARLATSWGLPEVLVDTIRFHHAPGRATIDPVLTATTHLAETLRWSIGLGDTLNGLSHDVSRSALELTGLNAAHFRGLDEHLLHEIARADDLISSQG